MQTVPDHPPLVQNLSMLLVRSRGKMVYYTIVYMYTVCTSSNELSRWLRGIMVSMLALCKREHGFKSRSSHSLCQSHVSLSQRVPCFQCSLLRQLKYPTLRNWEYLVMEYFGTDCSTGPYLSQTDWSASLYVMRFVHNERLTVKTGDN